MFMSDSSVALDSWASFGGDAISSGFWSLGGGWDSVDGEEDRGRRALDVEDVSCVVSMYDCLEVTV